MALVRNGRPAEPPVVADMNKLLARFTSVSSIDPECGSKEDSLFVSGMAGKERSGILVIWSPTDVRFAMQLARREAER